MLESIILWSILTVCALYVGKKFYNAICSAIDPKIEMSCGCSCSGCTTPGCDEQSKQI